MDRDSAACAASPPAAPSQPVPERKVDAAGAQERLHLDAISLWLDDALEEV